MSANLDYYSLPDPKKEDMAARDSAREIEALEREEDAAHGKVFNVCPQCNRMLYHASPSLAQECGKLA